MVLIKSFIKVAAVFPFYLTKESENDIYKREEKCIIWHDKARADQSRSLVLILSIIFWLICLIVVGFAGPLHSTFELLARIKLSIHLWAFVAITPDHIWEESVMDTAMLYMQWSYQKAPLECTLFPNSPPLYKLKGSQFLFDNKVSAEIGSAN